jgi:hypothetical protein
LRTGFACRVFYKEPQPGDRGLCLGDYSVPTGPQGPFMSWRKAQQTIYDMVNELEDKGCDIIEAQAVQIDIDGNDVVQMIDTFTLVEFADGGDREDAIRNQSVGEMQGKHEINPMWIARPEARLSPPFDDEFCKQIVTGETVLVKVGEKMPAIYQPFEIFQKKAA